MGYPSTFGGLPVEVVSPMKFVAIAEKMGPFEKLLSIMADVGLVHAGVLYVCEQADGQDEATRIEREAAQKRIRAGGPTVKS